jgi:hypothetical protein
MNNNNALNTIIKLEGDHYEFTHKGYRCIVGKKQYGALCGYVILPCNHKFYGKPYDDIPIHIHIHTYE